MYMPRICAYLAKNLWLTDMWWCIYNIPALIWIIWYCYTVKIEQKTRLVYSVMWCDSMSYVHKQLFLPCMTCVIGRLRLLMGISCVLSILLIAGILACWLNWAQSKSRQVWCLPLWWHPKMFWRASWMMEHLMRLDWR